MNESSVISPEMRAAIGVESEARVWEIEKGAVAKFALAVGDPNPSYSNELKARGSVHSGLIAPPTFLRLLKPGPPRAAYEQPLPFILDGGSQYRFLEPLRVGDQITVTSTLVEAFEKHGRLGLMLFRVHEVRYVNQFEQVVAIQRTTTINYGAQT